MPKSQTFALDFSLNDLSINHPIPNNGLNNQFFQISHYAGICNKRLERIGIGGRLDPKKPTLEDIDQSRLQIFRPSMFGGTLQV